MGIGIFQAVGDEGDPKGAEVQIPAGQKNPNDRFGKITGGKTDTRRGSDSIWRRINRGDPPRNI